MPIRYCHWCKERHEFCESCGIGIGLKHKFESYSFQVGKYILCSECQVNLFFNGQVELIPKAGKIIKPKWLNQDGEVRQSKRRLVLKP